MTLLYAGVILWSVVHLVPAVAPAFKARLVASLGAGPFKGLFALLIMLSLVLIVLGWRASTPAPVYLPPAWGHGAALVIMFASVVLFGAAHAKTNLKRVLRHPMLTGLLLWSIAHLLANGDSRSLVLFGGLGLWALIEMPLINRRDGAWERPAPASMRSEFISVAVAAVVFGVLLLLHPYFAGVNPLAVLR